MIADAIALVDFLRKTFTDAKGVYNDRKVFGAMFDWEGNRVEGDERLTVTKHNINEETIWFYVIEPINEYQFIRIPTNPGGLVESYGSEVGSGNRDARFFRYVGVPVGNIYLGEIFNVKTSFMVFAYRPSDMLALGKGKI